MNATSLQKQHTFGGSWTNVILGVWIVVSPFVLGFSHQAALMWNNVATGAAIFLLALGHFGNKGGPYWPVVLLGLWMILSPFVLHASRQIVVLNNLVLGIIVALVALGREKRSAHPAIAHR